MFDYSNKTRFVILIENMNRRFFLYFLLIFLISPLLVKAGPGNYYNIDSSKSCAAFKSILASRLALGSVSINYGDVDFYFNRTDSKPAESGGGSVIVDRYSGERPNGLDSCNYRYDVDFCSSGGTASSQCVCYVKEHSFPKSWFGGNVIPMYSEMHLLLPADNYTNNAKSNFPIGYVKTPSITSYNGTKIGSSDDSLNYGFNATSVFEPIDQFKGDFARIYLYMVTRYESVVASWISNSTANDVMAGNSYPALDPWILKLCVKWHKQDPPDLLERNRNDSVFVIQGNRNPYVDYPHWVEKVFGVDGIDTSCVITAVRTNSNSFTSAVFPNPANDRLQIQTVLPFPTKEASISVFDYLGRCILSHKINNGTVENNTINIASLPRGIYLLQIENDGATSMTKFVKE